MKIDILDFDELIAVNNLEQVTSHRLFSNKMMYDPEGILSSEIFGISKGDRRGTFAYVQLNMKFIHPHIYKSVLMSMAKEVTYIISGQRRYIVNDGLLVRDDENGWTGIKNLYDHWEEINWNKKPSTDSENKKILSTLPKNKIFIDKFLVSPPAYRDVTLTGTYDTSEYVNKVNDMYQRLIRANALLSEGGLFTSQLYGTQLRIQELLVEIFDFYKNQIARKKGLIKQNLLGKSVDYGCRAVISAPTYDHERFEDNMIDIEHIALPISMCISNFYPFIEAWLQNFFTREIINDPNMITYFDPATKKEVTAELYQPEVQFSERNIRKMMNDYALNPNNRFKVISIKVRIPDEKGVIKLIPAYMILKGKKILPNNIMQVLNRPMTVTDALYLACVDCCEKRHAMVSRYPVGTDKGIYFNRIRVQSTRNHVHLVFNGREYPYYPDIDLKCNHSKIGIQFIDTLVMSNSHLDGTGEKLSAPI